jgi:hypothetical protein
VFIKWYVFYETEDLVTFAVRCGRSLRRSMEKVVAE